MTAQSRSARPSAVDNFSALDLSAGIADLIEIIDGALVSPPLDEGRDRFNGVLFPDGRNVANAITWRDGRQFTHAPPKPDANSIVDLAGCYLYGGILFGHFGHFLVETIARLWALDHLPQPIDGLLFAPKNIRVLRNKAALRTEPLRMLGVDCPIMVAASALRVERLLVPVQGFGLGEQIVGAPEVHRFFAEHAGKAIPAKGPEKIYISRTALPQKRGGILGEARLESFLEAQGYTAFHPQTCSFEQQIATYKAARRIISVDASPLHLIALVGDPNQKVACIARRRGPFPQMFARQLKAFREIEATVLDALRAEWVPEADANFQRLYYGELDFERLSSGLERSGFISPGNKLKNLTEAEIAECKTTLEQQEQTTFTRKQIG